MNSTLELLRFAPECQYIDEEEDEVFFGPIRGKKETEGKNSRFIRRQTLIRPRHEAAEESLYPGPEASFDSWFSSESDMLILYEFLGEFYDEEFEKMSYQEKKALKDKVRVSVPKSPEELLRLFPEEPSILLSGNFNEPISVSQGYKTSESIGSKPCATNDILNITEDESYVELAQNEANAIIPSPPCSTEEDLNITEDESPHRKDPYVEFLQTEENSIFPPLVSSEDEDSIHDAEIEDEESSQNSLNHSILSSSSFSSYRLPSEQNGPSDDIENDVKDFSEWFEPIEELILFDILGIDYRELFEGMTLQEKKALRSRVDATEPKSSEEILAMLNDDDEADKVQEPSVPLTESRPSYSLAKKEKSRRLTLIAQNPPEKRIPSRKKSPEAHVFKTPLRQRGPPPSYLKPTAASVQKEYSPRGGASTCPRCPETPGGDFSPCKQPTHHRLPPIGIDLSKVVSPVAQYIHSSPAPPIIRNIKPSSSQTSKRFPSESKENISPVKASVVHFAPLPEANYKASSLVKEQELENPKPRTVLKSCFPSTESVEPKIIRHLGRVKVPKSMGDNEDPLLLPSPGSSLLKTTLRKNPPRESAISGASSNESMIDMSVHEVKAVQKLSHLHI